MVNKKDLGSIGGQAATNVAQNKRSMACYLLHSERSRLTGAAPTEREPEGPFDPQKRDEPGEPTDPNRLDRRSTLHGGLEKLPVPRTVHQVRLAPQLRFHERLARIGGLAFGVGSVRGLFGVGGRVWGVHEPCGNAQLERYRVLKSGWKASRRSPSGRRSPAA